MPEKTTALLASDAPPRTKPSNYPEPFASRMAGRIKRPLGDLFSLTNFGVNLTSLPPAQSRHCITGTPGKTSSFISSRVSLLCLPPRARLK